jgi:hypothetical protein
MWGTGLARTGVGKRIPPEVSLKASNFLGGGICLKSFIYLNANAFTLINQSVR